MTTPREIVEMDQTETIDAGHSEKSGGHLSRDDAFKNALRYAINVHSRENGSNTPDYILAEYLFDCLQAFETANVLRDRYKDTRLIAEAVSQPTDRE